MEHSKALVIGSWILRLAAAIILLQTLFFKFSGARESVYIFSALGAEPWGRIGSGVIELIAAALLLYPRTPALGAMLSMAVMIGAIGAHITKLGVTLPEVGDRGELLALAVIVFLCSAAVLFLHRHELPAFGSQSQQLSR
jgi:hypothetical protein